MINDRDVSDRKGRQKLNPETLLLEQLITWSGGLMETDPLQLPDIGNKFASQYPRICHCICLHKPLVKTYFFTNLHIN